MIQRANALRSAGIVLAAAAGWMAAEPPATAAPPDAPASAERYWPQWRGPLGNGEAPHARPPVEWAENKNVRWKVPLPGSGKSTPVIWGDLVFLTASIGVGVPAAPTTAPGASARRPPVVPADRPQEFVLLAVGRNDGRVRWQRTLRTELPHEGTHADGSFAGGSALTDGARVYAFFGSRGLYALDLAGKLLWQKDLGRMQTRNAFGEGSTPALHDGTLVVNWDHEGEDFIAAYDARTGEERWRRRRDEPTGWSTPHVVVHQDRAQVVVGGTQRLRSYDLATGEPVWDAPGLTANVIPTPVSAHGVVYATSGFRGNALRAIRLADARGAVEGPPGLAWSYDRDTPYVPSPLLYRDALYFLKSNSGVLTCLDARSGEQRYLERLEALPNVYASPVAADGRIYVVGREGTAVVLAAGPVPKRLATNTLDDRFDASPALVDEELYLRGARSLYRIESLP
jgi:outer membrane protein assembly factor BamB